MNSSRSSSLGPLQPDERLPRSDIDLATVGITDRYRMVGRLAFDLEDLPIPQKCEVQAYETIELRSTETPHRRVGRYHIRKAEPTRGSIMKRVYKAILRGDRVQWLNGALDEEGPLLVEITVTKELDPKEEAVLSKPVSQLFQELADMGAFSEIDDPVAWQREIRKDRPLPGRD